MPVIFDEVIGTVEPELPPAGGPESEEDGGSGAAVDPMALRRELRIRARRDARLHAD
jgi:hypothetical protein